MLQFIALQQQAAPAGGGYSGIIMIVLLIAVFYFFMIRPQQKRQKEIRKMREALGKGDRIVTAGGIHGKIADVREKTFLVEIASGVKITVEKDSVYVSSADANDSQLNQEQKA